MIDFLKGKKTYIIAALAVATAVVQYVAGDISLIDLGNAVLASGAIGSLRGAISRVGQ